MCGIVGVYSLEKSVICKNIIEKPLSKLILRGPDSQSISEFGNCILGHTRLSIIDITENGMQPMHGGQNDRYTIVFNGEIYNYKILREELVQLGYNFKSNSDTEVLINLYDYLGPNMKERLQGMYAFCIFDTLENSIYITRDNFGIKPLYYYFDSKYFAFSSQIKSIVEFDFITKKESFNAKIGYLLLGSVPEPFTPFEGVYCLMPGSDLFVNTIEKVKIINNFNLGKYAGSSRIKSDNISEYIFDSLKKSVEKHFISDVKVGIFLSSGIDSAYLSNMSNYLGYKDVNTFTISFDELDEKNYDESSTAINISVNNQQHYEHEKVNYDSFLENYDSIITAMDTPSIDGINTYFVSRLAKSKGYKVALSGAGADELFLGYDLFTLIPRFLKIRNLFCLRVTLDFFYCIFFPVLSRFRLFHLFKPNITLFELYLVKRGIFSLHDLKKMFGENNVLDAYKELSLDKLIFNATNEIENVKSKLSIIEFSLYLKNQLLKDADWASMYNSVEIRLPYVDTVLFRELFGLQDIADYNKEYLVKSISLHNPILKEVYRKKKKSFTTPIKLWLARKFDLKQMDNKTLLLKIYDEYFNSFDSKIERIK